MKLHIAAYCLYIRYVGNDYGASMPIYRDGKQLDRFDSPVEYEFHGASEARTTARKALAGYRRRYSVVNERKLKCLIEYVLVDERGEAMDCIFEAVHEDGTIKEEN